MSNQELPFAQRHAKALIVASGVGLGVLGITFMMLRGYTGRPLLLNDDGVTVKQTKIVCPPARTALTQSFNKADPSTPSQIRVCVETGRARAFVTGLMLLFVGLATWGASHLPEGRVRRRPPAESSHWESAIARAGERRDQQSA